MCRTGEVSHVGRFARLRSQPRQRPTVSPCARCCLNSVGTRPLAFWQHPFWLQALVYRRAAAPNAAVDIIAEPGVRARSTAAAPEPSCRRAERHDRPIAPRGRKLIARAVREAGYRWTGRSPLKSVQRTVLPVAARVGRRANIFWRLNRRSAVGHLPFDGKRFVYGPWQPLPRQWRVVASQLWRTGNNI